MLATALVVYFGAAAVAAAVLVAGWGLIWITLFHLLPMGCAALSFSYLLPRETAPGIVAQIWIRWVRESINSLMPVGQVGGDFVSIRLLMQRAVQGSSAAAAVVADLTVGAVTQGMFVLAGIVVLLFHTASAQIDGILPSILIGLLVLGAGIGGFLYVQRKGMFTLLSRLAGIFAKSEKWQALHLGAGRIDDAVRQIYRDPRRLALSAGWRLLGWTAGTGEIWLALHFLGHPVTLAEAFILESLGQAVRGAAFMIPGALGVQEGGFVLFGAIFGIGPERALALSLVKRVRELALGVPGLLSWQWAEGRNLVGKTKS